MAQERKCWLYMTEGLREDSQNPGKASIVGRVCNQSTAVERWEVETREFLELIECSACHT